MESNTTRFSSTSLEDSAIFGKVGHDFFSSFLSFSHSRYIHFCFRGEGGPSLYNDETCLLASIAARFLYTENRTSLAGLKSQ